MSTFCASAFAVEIDWFSNIRRIDPTMKFKFLSLHVPKTNPDSVLMECAHNWGADLGTKVRSEFNRNQKSQHMARMCAFAAQCFLKVNQQFSTIPSAHQDISQDKHTL